MLVVQGSLVKVVVWCLTTNTALLLGVITDRGNGHTLILNTGPLDTL